MIGWRQRQHRRLRGQVSPQALAGSAARFSMTARRYMMGCARIGHGSPVAERALAEAVDDLWRCMDAGELERVEKALRGRGGLLRMGLALFANKAPPITAAIVSRRGAMLHITLGKSPPEPAFVEVHPRCERLERLFLGLLTPQWLLSLGAMYLFTGRYAPREVRGGCSFGFCDAGGIRKAKQDASHVGWTLDQVTT